MKTTLKLLCLSVLITLAACQKDHENDHHEPALTKTQLLLKKPWIVQEVRALESNNLSIYERGVTNNGLNYDNEVLTFKDSTSGTVKDIYGVTSNFTWKFLNTDQTKMVLTIQYSTGDAELNYNMVNISENNFTTTLNYTTKSGVIVLASVRRIWQ